MYHWSLCEFVNTEILLLNLIGGIKASTLYIFLVDYEMLTHQLGKEGSLDFFKEVVYKKEDMQEVKDFDISS